MDTIWRQTARAEHTASSACSVTDLQDVRKCYEMVSRPQLWVLASTSRYPLSLSTQSLQACWWSGGLGPSVPRQRLRRRVRDRHNGTRSSTFHSRIICRHFSLRATGGVRRRPWVRPLRQRRTRGSNGVLRIRLRAWQGAGGRPPTGARARQHDEINLSINSGHVRGKGPVSSRFGDWLLGTQPGHRREFRQT